MKYSKEIVQYFEQIKSNCNAIYLGGSRIDPVIDNPHDYDFICFAKPLKMHILPAQLEQLGFPQQDGTDRTKLKTLLDMTQIRQYPYNEIDWFSYLDHLMIKVVGDDVCPDTDIINTNRQDFLKDLRYKAECLLTEWCNYPKRWYHILRGVYILMNNSYEVTEEQKKEINILHDLTPGWEGIVLKTVNLLAQLK